MTLNLYIYVQFWDYNYFKFIEIVIGDVKYIISISIYNLSVHK